MARKQTSEKEIVVSGSGSAAARSRRKPAAASSRPKRNTGASEPVAASLPAETVAVPVEMTAPSAGAVARYQPSHREIAALAYSYWEGRGCQGGSPEQDWLRAELELSAGRNAVN